MLDALLAYTESSTGNASPSLKVVGRSSCAASCAVNGAAAEAAAAARGSAWRTVSPVTAFKPPPPRTGADSTDWRSAGVHAATGLADASAGADSVRGCVLTGSGSSAVARSGAGCGRAAGRGVATGCGAGLGTATAGVASSCFGGSGRCSLTGALRVSGASN